MAEVQVALSSEQFDKFMDLQELGVKQAFSVPDCAKLLSMSERRLRDLITRGGFPALHVGKRILIPRSALLDWLDQLVQVERG